MATNHLNNNILCGLDIQTSGPDPKKHDILQVSLVRSTITFEPDHRTTPYSVMMRPEKPESDAVKEYFNKWPYSYADAQTQGIDQLYAAEFLVDWKDKLLPHEKRIIPICFDWATKKPFLVEWLGQLTFDLLFHTEVRDPLPVLCACNDRAFAKGMVYPYPKPWLERFVQTHMRIENPFRYDTTFDADAVIKVYGRLIDVWNV